MGIRIRMYGLVVGIATLFAAGIYAQQGEHETTDKQLLDLLNEKRGVLKKRFDNILVGYEKGTEEYDAVLMAEELLLQTELELARDSKRRIEIYRKRVKNYRIHEDRKKVLLKNGHASHDQYFLATANRIQAEIDLLREESR